MNRVTVLVLAASLSPFPELPLSPLLAVPQCPASQPSFGPRRIRGPAPIPVRLCAHTAAPGGPQKGESRAVPGRSAPPQTPRKAPGPPQPPEQLQVQQQPLCSSWCSGHSWTTLTPPNLLHPEPPSSPAPGLPAHLPVPFLFWGAVGGGRDPGRCRWSCLHHPTPHPPKAGKSRFLSAFLIQCVHFWDAPRLRSHFLASLPPSLGAFGVLLNQGWAPPAPLQESGAADKEEPPAGQRPPEQRLTLPQSGCAPPPPKKIGLPPADPTAIPCECSVGF